MRTVAVFALAGCSALGGPPPDGTLHLSIVDELGRSVPARIEVIDDQGDSWVAADGLPVAGDCGRFPWHNFAGSGRRQLKRALDPRVPDPIRGVEVFYADGSATLELPPGRYAVRATRGPEVAVATAHVEVSPGAVLAVELESARWLDLSADGWHSADDHLHIPRPHPSFDPILATWMRAEDLDVANLLQAGLSSWLHVTPQRAFGLDSVYDDGGVLASGQENPRTHLLGHAIVLGADRWLHRPGTYMAYDEVFREAHDLGALAGMAHWGLGGSDLALALWAREGLVDFVEVLGFGLGHANRWYEALDLGLRIAPTAGSDWPCGPALPGRDRFMTRTDGPLTYASWLEGVRAGRTVVTNGPWLTLSVGGVDVGETLLLDGPGSVQIEGEVRLDPARDAVPRLELVGAGGVVLAAVDVPEGADRALLSVELPVERSAWVALRAEGTRVQDPPIRDMEGLRHMLVRVGRPSDLALAKSDALQRDGDPRTSFAHTAAIWIDVAGTPPVGAQPRAREVAELWSQRLDELQAILNDEEQLEALSGFPGDGDGVSRRKLFAAREALLEAIEDAR